MMSVDVLHGNGVVVRSCQVQVGHRLELEHAGDESGDVHVLQDPASQAYLQAPAPLLHGSIPYLPTRPPNVLPTPKVS
jgi:hypothetical protein